MLPNDFPGAAGTKLARSAIVGLRLLPLVSQVGGGGDILNIDYSSSL